MKLEHRVIFFHKKHVLNREVPSAREIHEEIGYTTIKIKEVEIISDTNTILHVIDFGEIDSLLMQIETNILNINMDNKELLNTVVADIKGGIHQTILRALLKLRGS